MYTKKMHRKIQQTDKIEKNYNMKKSKYINQKNNIINIIILNL